MSPHCSQLPEMKLPLFYQQYLHGTGRSKTSIGAYGRKHSDYRFGAQTEIGDIEISVWEAAMHRLIQSSGEEALYQALLAWVEADTPWLHTKKERELYALELHYARIFELPEWVAKQEFEENYMPKRDYPDAVIVQEVFTRTRLDRPEWLKLMRRIQPGDEIVFDSVSRMSGDAKEGFAAYEELYQKGVNLVYLKEPHINTETYKKALENNVQLTGSNVDYILEGVNRYLLELAKEQIRLAFEQSEKEVQDLHQRTREGIETARLNGKQIGRQKNSVVVTRKSIESKEVIRKLSKEFGGNLSDAEIMRLTGLARNTYYKYKRELRGK